MGHSVLWGLNKKSVRRGSSGPFRFCLNDWAGTLLVSCPQTRIYTISNTPLEAFRLRLNYNYNTAFPGLQLADDISWDFLSSIITWAYFKTHTHTHTISYWILFLWKTLNTISLNTKYSSSMEKLKPECTAKTLWERQSGLAPLGMWKASSVRKGREWAFQTQVII